jgi:Flp pilus assembly protein TadD
MNPENPSIERLAAAGRGAEAEREIRRVLAEDSECRRGWSLLGDLLIEEGRYEEARNAFEKLEALAMTRGERAAALAGLARAAWKAGDPAGGAELMREALRASHKDPYLMSRRVLMLLEAEDFEVAERETRRLESMSGVGAEERVYAGSAFADQGMKDRAALLFSRAEAEAKEPGSLARVVQAVGIAWETAGESTLAEDAYRRARGIDPRWGDPANNLAWLLLDEGRTQQALPLAREAVARGPEDGYYLGTLGRAYLSAGMPDSAVMVLERAVRALVGKEIEARAVTQLELARAYLGMGRADEARVSLGEAESLGLKGRTAAAAESLRVRLASPSTRDDLW